MDEETNENTSEETNDNSRETNPHWLIEELNEILEKGMFKHD